MPTRVEIRSPPPIEEKRRTRVIVASPAVSVRKSMRTKRGSTHLKEINADDIRSSTRMTGYIISLLASSIQLVSVIQFFERDSGSPTPFRALIENSSNPFTNIILDWKRDACFYLSLGGVTLYVILIMVHFDAYCFPSVWKRVFRDGSRYEFGLICFLIIFWAASLHICTSVFSIGAAQANVYFTTWIGFIATILNLDAWRDASDLPTYGSFLEQSPRETTKGWLWLCIFNVILGLSLIDVFIHREINYFYVDGEKLFPGKRFWMETFGVIYGSLLIALLTLGGNHVFKWSYEVRLCSSQEMTFDWPLIECAIILLLLGIWGWIVLDYTGSKGLVNSPGNAYFGVWGSFFASISLFATWLRETKASAEKKSLNRLPQ